MDVDELGRSLTAAKLAFEENAETVRHLEGSERQTALENELDRVARLNDVLRSVIRAVDTAGHNIEQTRQAADNTHQVLDRWIAVMSQTDHTYRLLRNPAWPGASKDLEVQAERARQRELERQRQEQARREAEERARQEAERERLRREKEEVRNRRIYGQRAPPSAGGSGAATAQRTRPGAVPRGRVVSGPAGRSGVTSTQRQPPTRPAHKVPGPRPVSASGSRIASASRPAAPSGLPRPSSVAAARTASGVPQRAPSAASSRR